MITHTPTFETSAFAPVKTTDVVVAKQVLDPYGYYDDTLVWTSSDVLMSVQIDSVGAFLGTATKKAVIKLLGIVSTAIAGDTFQVRLGLHDGAAFEYISQGFYIVEDVAFNYEAGSTTITTYDYMWKAQNTSYSNFAAVSGFTFPATVADLAQQMASAIGVDLMGGFSSLPNATYNILVDPFATISNATLQTAIQEIAAATGTSARISDTTLMFQQYALNRKMI